jgi:hypothetical protein
MPLFARDARYFGFSAHVFREGTYFFLSATCFFADTAESFPQSLETRIPHHSNAILGPQSCASAPEFFWMSPCVFRAYPYN